MVNVFKTLGMVRGTAFDARNDSALPGSAAFAHFDPHFQRFLLFIAFDLDGQFFVDLFRFFLEAISGRIGIFFRFSGIVGGGGRCRWRRRCRSGQSAPFASGAVQSAGNADVRQAAFAARHDAQDRRRFRQFRHAGRPAGRQSRTRPRRRPRNKNNSVHLNCD